MSYFLVKSTHLSRSSVGRVIILVGIIYLTKEDGCTINYRRIE